MDLKEKPGYLQEKPARQAGNKRVLLIVLLGGLVLLAGGALIFWLVLASPTSSTIQPGVVASTPTAEPTKSGTGDPQVYYDAVENYVAQQLHLSKAEIKAKLISGVQLIALATQQGLSNDQLRTVLLTAEQKGHDVLVQGGYLTQQQSDGGMQDLRTRTLQTLATSIKYDFLDH